MINSFRDARQPDQEALRCEILQRVGVREHEAWPVGSGLSPAVGWPYLREGVTGSEQALILLLSCLPVILTWFMPALPGGLVSSLS